MSDKLTALAADVGALLQSRGLKVLTVESCTGGGIAEALTRVPGSSGWFDRAWVTYSNIAKVEEVGVPDATLREHGAVSGQVVTAMVRGALAQVQNAWAVAVSGIAGPDGGTPAKPVGTVWIAWAGPGNTGIVTQDFLFRGDRAAVRSQAVEAALRGLKILVGN